ncbi:MAG: hypothetical protein GF350_08570 [Chitinivibrionales bacterium]|nr:hypothetical protein [Chitinivibrionales bacterium]
MKLPGKIIFLSALLYSAGLAAGDALPVFPGAQGFGSYTPAGRGGSIIRVTNLNDDGPGSLREAVEQAGPRIVVFEVGGIITQNAYLHIRDPYITIAGQTAPPPGITLTGRQGIWISTHDILIQHIAVRLSDSREPWISSDQKEERCTMVAHNRRGDLYNVLFDHCSFMWHNGKVSLWGNCDENSHRDITFSHCIIAEGLQNSIHHEGAHSKGLLIGNIVRKVSVLRCLFSHNWDRNPVVKGGSRAVIVNNIVYNPGYNGIIGTLATFCGGMRSVRMVAIGNVLQSGVNTGLGSGSLVGFDGGGSSVIYYEDNSADGNYRADNGDTAYMSETPQDALWHESIKMLPVEHTRNCVLSNVGPRPLDRDTVERRVIRDVVNGSGEIIDSPSEVGGLPDHTMTNRVLDIPSSPHADDDNDGYTNVEELLHEMAAELESPSSCTDTGLSIGSRQKLPHAGMPKIVVQKKQDTFILRLPFPEACTVDICRLDGKCIYRIRRQHNKPLSIEEKMLCPGLNILKFGAKANCTILR